MYGKASATNTISAPKRNPPKEATKVTVDTAFIVRVFVVHISITQAEREREREKRDDF